MPALRFPRLALALGVLTSAGCYTWRSAPATTPDAGDRSVRVTVDRGQRRIELEAVTVRADSVIGSLFRVEVRDEGGGWQPLRPQPPLGQRTAIARDDVISIESRQLHGGRTAGLTIALVVLGALAAFIWAVSQIEY